MNNKFLKAFVSALLVLGGWFMLSSFSPSLDGRAVVVDEGVFPEGLFAKTVGYLPGDIISVSSINGDGAVDLLVIGALDPSQGVAIMLTPEAADAVGIDRNANNIVKITKRANQEDRVYGTAVIAKLSSDTPSESTPVVDDTDASEVLETIPDDSEDDDDLADNVTETEEELVPEVIIPEETAVAKDEDSVQMDEVPVDYYDALETPDETEIAEPVSVPENNYEQYIADDEFSDYEDNDDNQPMVTAVEEDYKLPEDSIAYEDDNNLEEYKEDSEEEEPEIVENNDTFEDYDLPVFDEEETETAESSETAVPEDKVTEEVKTVSLPLPVEEEIFQDEVPVDEEVTENKKNEDSEKSDDIPAVTPFEEEVTETVVTPEPEPAEPAEEEVTETLVLPENAEETAPVEEEIASDSEPVEDSEESVEIAEVPESVELTDEEPVVKEELPEETYTEEPVEEETEIAEAPVEETPVEEDSDDSEVYEGIVLIPAGTSNEINTAATEPEVTETPVEPVIAEPEPVEEIPVAAAENTKPAEVSVPQPVQTATASAPKSYEKYMVQSASDLVSGKYYVQIASMKNDEYIQEICDKYGKNYPITIVPTASGLKQILIGPMNVDEYGTVIERFKAYGYKDAFLKKIK